MAIQHHLSHLIAEGIKTTFSKSIDANSIDLQPTKKEFEGHYTFVTFSLAKELKQSPEQIGDAIGKYIQANSSLITRFNVVKGFLNLVVEDKVWIDIFSTILQEKEYGRYPSNNQSVMVEYSSPNTNKPLHLGHLRTNFLGYSVAEILKYYGYHVIKVNLVNDRGIHICKSMIAYQKFGNNETPESLQMKGDHFVGKYYVKFDQEYQKEIKELQAQGKDLETAKKEAPLFLQAQQMLQQWEKGDQGIMALWKKMNNWVYSGFEKTYKKIGVDFDKYYYESNTYLLGKDTVEEGLKKNVFLKKEDGSVWIDLTADGLDQKLVQRADGTSVYITQDLGTADLKYKDFHMDKSIYVVGNEQDYHFHVLFLILKKLGRPYADGLYHLSYGMIDLPSGKMKSREGTVVDADELVDEMIQTAEQQTKELGKIEELTEEEAHQLYYTLGLGALKYFILKVDPKKRMLFNPQESIQFQGDTGPFIQYTHARICAILRRAAEMDIDYQKEKFSSIQSLHTIETSIIQLISNFPEKIKEAATTYSPAVISQYIFELAKEYNRFYAELSIFGEKDQALIHFRVALSATIAHVIKTGMKLLGIHVPERM